MARLRRPRRNRQNHGSLASVWGIWDSVCISGAGAASKRPVRPAVRGAAQIPLVCQWVNFLRNDELDLGRLSDNEGESYPARNAVYAEMKLESGQSVPPGARECPDPMQWNGIANAGFSRAPQEQLVHTVIARGESRFKRVNVDAQQWDSESLLSRTERRCASGGLIRNLDAANANVLAHLLHKGEWLLLVHNLSEQVVTYSLSCPRWNASRTC
jgi:hypothetical protein